MAFFMNIICPVDLVEKDSLASAAAVNLSGLLFLSLTLKSGTFRAGSEMGQEYALHVDSWM